MSAEEAQELLKRITFEADKCGGRPCIRGMRIRVSDVLELLATGMSQEKILEEHPDLEVEDLFACLLYASQQTNHAVITA
ncbi:MAG: DUF433 domain-containing protein [Fimbriimonadaceae bacterium]